MGACDRSTSSRLARASRHRVLEERVGKALEKRVNKALEYPKVVDGKKQKARPPPTQRRVRANRHGQARVITARVVATLGHRGRGARSCAQRRGTSGLVQQQTKMAV